MDPLITIDEAAKVLTISRSHAYSLAKEGILPVVRLGRRVRVSTDALAAFIESGGQSLPGGWRRESEDDGISARGAEG